jgi:hypothetical protein
MIENAGSASPFKLIVGIGVKVMAVRAHKQSVRMLTPDEQVQRVDEAAHRLLGMSAETFVRELNAGHMQARLNEPDVRYVAMLSQILE